MRCLHADGAQPPAARRPPPAMITRHDHARRLLPPHAAGFGLAGEARGDGAATPGEQRGTREGGDDARGGSALTAALALSDVTLTFTAIPNPTRPDPTRRDAEQVTKAERALLDVLEELLVTEATYLEDLRQVMPPAHHAHSGEGGGEGRCALARS